MRRRDVLKVLAAAALSGVVPRIGLAADDDPYDIGRFGNARVLHMTDTHAQLLPVYFREPSVNIGVGAMAGQPPHLVGQDISQTFRHRAGQPRVVRLHLPRLSGGRASLRPHGRLRPSEDPDRPAAQ